MIEIDASFMQRRLDVMSDDFVLEVLSGGLRGVIDLSDKQIDAVASELDDRNQHDINPQPAA